MTSERRAEVARWRDLMLWIHWRNEGAKARLSPTPTGFDDALMAAVGILPPSDDELRGCDIQGEPLDPYAPWWGHQGPSEVDKAWQRKFEAAFRPSKDKGGFR